MMTETLANIHLNKQQKKVEKEKAATAVARSNSALSSPILLQMKNDSVKRAGSFVVGQKLRESKWFTHEETKIFYAVVESGFIIEQKGEDESRYGVAVWSPGNEKSKNPEHLTFYTIAENKGKFRVLACTMEEFWPPTTTVRINNKSDKTETPLSEEMIRNQIVFAQNVKRKWHNTEHFAYFCRYGPVETHLRIRKITEQLRSNNFLLKIRRLTTK